LMFVDWVCGEVARTVVVKSAPLPRRAFKTFTELEGMYRNMVEQLTMCAVRNSVASFTKLKAMKYGELRALYPHLPSHYAYTACQDASTRAKSFLRLKKKSLTSREYLEVGSVSIWLDDHLWKPKDLTAIEVATHKGWVRVGLEPHEQYWRYVNIGWKISSGARIKLDRKARRLIIYLTFKKSIEVYEPRGFVTVDVNEDHVAVLIEDKVYLFKTGFRGIVLGYYCRRKRVQEKKLKNDLRWKLANIIVKAAKEGRYAIVLEELGKSPAREMINHVMDDQLRHRMYQASFRGVQRAIEEEARERGVPVVYVDPKNTSRRCPVRSTPIAYSNSSRVGRCSVGGELWHRDVVACINLLIRARLGDGSSAPSLGGPPVDVPRVPFGATATHDPTPIAREVWARWKSLDETSEYKLMRMSI